MDGKLAVIYGYILAEVSILNDYMDIGGTRPRKDEGRIMQEQLSRVTQKLLPRSIYRPTSGVGIARTGLSG